MELQAVNYFPKKLHLRCWTGFWILLLFIIIIIIVVIIIIIIIIVIIIFIIIIIWLRNTLF